MSDNDREFHIMYQILHGQKKREIPIKHLQFNSVNPLSDWPVFIQATDRIVELILYIL